MLVATTRLVTRLLVLIVHSGAPQLIQVIFKGDGAVVADHGVPFGDDASFFDALIMGGRAVVVSVVNVETPPAILP